jgi:DNA invertase Pin-like site-specific DNA recombinase
MPVWGYVRVSTDDQNTKNQKLAILDYTNKHHLTVDNWIEIKISSKRSIKERRIDELLSRIQKGDTLIVAELSRLGRSVGQIATLVDKFIQIEVKVICLKENIELNGKASIQNKVMITMFSLFAEIERDLVSERTKEGLARARVDGKLLGRPKGSLGKSKMDGKEQEVKWYLEKGVNKANIAKIYGVSWPTLNNFIKTRKINDTA